MKKIILFLGLITYVLLVCLQSIVPLRQLLWTNKLRALSERRFLTLRGPLRHSSCFMGHQNKNKKILTEFQTLNPHQGLKGFIYV